MSPQQKRILKALLSRKYSSHIDLMQVCRIAGVTQRISELRRMGVDIKFKKVKHKSEDGTNCDYANYYIKNFNESKKIYKKALIAEKHKAKP